MDQALVTLMGLWAVIKSGLSALIAGILGAAVSLKFAPDMSTWEKVTTVTAGACLAHFLSDPIVAYLDFKDYHETVGFLVGLFGLSLCAAVLKVFKDTDFAGILTRFIERKTGG